MTKQADPDGRGREWVSFIGSDGDTWMFDLTFFRSSWRCIYGDGCQGIEETPDPGGHRGCCSYGAHFVDDADLHNVVSAARGLPADVWQNHDAAPLVGDPTSSLDDIIEELTTVDDDGDRVTRVVEGACIFLNGPNAEAGPGCAFHIAAVNAELDPMSWKPEVCWQLPMRVEHHVDDHEQHTHFVRQWTRNDWGSGDDLGWWCSNADAAYSGAVTVAESLRAEVATMAGSAVADALIAHIRRSGTVVTLPAPARRS